jgi:enterochelin esterase family protein
MSAAISPRIADLRRRIEGGDPAALDAFWREVAEEGAPIVEPISGDDAHRLVTFVYRAAGSLENVAVIPGIERAYQVRENLLEHLSGTDVWYRTQRARSDLRATYYFSLDDPMRALHEMDLEELARYERERTSAWLSDPLNPRQFPFEPNLAPHSIIELPHAPPQPYLVKRDGVPEGTIRRQDLASDPFGEARRIWTYLPPGYDPARGPYPLLLQLDGWGSRKLGLHTTLDNMIVDGVIPPAIAVMIHQLDRNIELPCNEAFADWLAQEFVPSWVRARYAVTHDPARTVVSGMSYGGLAAAWCAFRHPGAFGNVLSQSGSYWWRPESEPHEWLTRQFEASPLLPLRMHLDIGLLEDAPRPGGCPNMVDANRHMRDVLAAKGYDVQYAEYNGGHDYVSWRGTLADGLAFLLAAPSR